MLAAQPIEHLPCRLGAPGLHVRKSVLNPFDGFDAVEQRLVETEGFTRKLEDVPEADFRLANRRLQPLGHLTV